MTRGKDERMIEKVLEFIQDREVITSVALQENFDVLYVRARKLVENLQEQGVISREWDARLGGYRVLDRR